jgi:GNAT superfamily N-acetyltransferase
VEAIVEITNRAFLAEQFCVTGDRTDAADIRQRFATGVFFVADDPADRAHLLGSVFCSVENSRGYLGLLAVQPDAQGRGYSRVLLAAVEKYCRDAGCNFLDITVVNVREDLFLLYARLGFAASDLLPFPVPERATQQLHLVKMTKPLLPLSRMSPSY